MSEQDLPDELPVEDRREGPFSVTWLVWLVPIIALAIALGAAWRNFADRGPIIEVTFTDASGVTPSQTELRFRDISVGLVESVGFTEDLEHVVVSIRVEKDVADYVDADSQFWVVRPEVTTQGVRGLDTVLSGVYIQGAWDGSIGEPETRFSGFDDAPLLATDARGVTFRLRSDNSLPTVETPILYKGVEVGRVAEAEISPGGTGVEAEAVIYAPFDDLVTTSTRFWDTSGFSFSLGTAGAQLNFSSLASLITGGVTFETFASGGTPLVADMTYDLHPDEESAREDFFLESEGNRVDVTMVFQENLSGLTTGAPVELGGLRVGEVAAISGLVDEERFGDADVRLIATLRLNPTRIGLGEDADAEELFDYLDTRIGEGLRGRLTNASLLTGGLKIEMMEMPEAPAATLDRAADPFPAIPTAAPDVTDVTASAQGLLQRVDDLPVEELLESAINFLDSAESLVGSDGMQAAPGDLQATLAAIRGVAESEEVQALPAQISTVVADVQSASARLDGLLAQLDEDEAIAKLTAAIESLRTTADSLPAVVSEAEALLAQVRELPLDQLVTKAGDLADTASALVNQEATQALPGNVNAALTELRETVGAIRTIAESEDTQALPGQVSALTTDLQTASGRLNDLLLQLETQEAATRLTTAINDIATASADLPALVEEARGIVSDVGEVPLDELANRASALLDAAEGIIGQESAREVPAQLNAALGELRTSLAALREGGAVDNANAALISAREAADALAAASADLPELSAQLEATAAQASATLSGYGDNSQFSRDLRLAFRQIQSAADSVERLARRLERDPNSLLFGR